jgi:hypothetical protein
MEEQTVTFSWKLPPYFTILPTWKMFGRDFLERNGDRNGKKNLGGKPTGFTMEDIQHQLAGIHHLGW